MLYSSSTVVGPRSRRNAPNRPHCRSHTRRTPPRHAAGLGDLVIGRIIKLFLPATDDPAFTTTGDHAGDAGWPSVLNRGTGCDGSQSHQTASSSLSNTCSSHVHRGRSRGRALAPASLISVLTLGSWVLAWGSDADVTMGTPPHSVAMPVHSSVASNSSPACGSVGG